MSLRTNRRYGRRVTGIAHDDVDGAAPASIIDWLLSLQCRTLDVAGLVDGLAQRLTEHGLQPWRVSTSLRTLHPEVWVTAVVWRRGEGAIMAPQAHEVETAPRFLNSPIALIYGGAESVRCRLDGPDADLRFPICADIAREGGTDYLCLSLPFAGPRAFASVTTDRVGGFTDAQVAMVRSLVPALSLRLELEAEHVARRGLLEVYLGALAARRVMAGAVKRGRGESIRAAVWTCDLRDFTSISDGADPAHVVELLDAYFDCMAGAVIAAGGEVLKFVGDAVLAIFPCGDDEVAARRAALAAARDGLAHLQALVERTTADEGPALRCGVGLHIGDVYFGNIGAGARLDFTVIGAAVNTACRVESMCKGLDASLLMTDAFVAPGLDAAVRSLGVHGLKGMARPVELFTLAD